MKSLGLVLALSVTACSSRNANLQVRYTGVVFLTAAAVTIIEPRFNGDGFDTKLLVLGSALGTVGAGLLVGSILALPDVRKIEAADAARLHQRQLNLKAVALLHQAEAAAGKEDCATVVQLAPQIDGFDPGVGSVLRANVAAARCLKAEVSPKSPPEPEPTQ